MVNGQPVDRATSRKRRSSASPTINGVFGNRFQTTGLTMNEARETALLLRGGALAAPISIANERVIGPQLGQENIEKGVQGAGHRHGGAVRRS